MVLHTGDGPNLLMSIPRDSLVEVPGYGTTKINAAYAYDGAELLIKTIENETGIRIDHFVEVGFGGFVDLVDAVGGIEVCPPFAMDDPLAEDRPEEGLPGGRRPDRAGLRPVPQDRRAVRRPRPGVSASARSCRRSAARRSRRGRSSTRSATTGSTWPAPAPCGSARAPRPFAMAQWALAMTRVNGENGLTCGVPVADFAVNWDEERSEQMFKYIIEDDTASIPKSLCTPTGFPR